MCQITDTSSCIWEPQTLLTFQKTAIQFFKFACQPIPWHTEQALGQAMAALVVQERHLWLNLSKMRDVEKVCFLDAPSPKLAVLCSKSPPWQGRTAPQLFPPVSLITQTLRKMEREQVLMVAPYLPHGNESSLYQGHCNLLGFRKWHTVGRHLQSCGQCYTQHLPEIL